MGKTIVSGGGGRNPLAVLKNKSRHPSAYDSRRVLNGAENGVRYALFVVADECHQGVQESTAIPPLLDHTSAGGQVAARWCTADKK